MGNESHATFARPALGWFLVLDGGVAALATLALSRRAYEAARGIGPLPAQQRLRQLLVATAGVHVAEATVAVRQARRRGLPPGRWALQTFVVGFPSLLRLRSLTAG